ncbi:MAG: tRNA pseudouridine(55) synthase TruB [Lachnospiraceae bacterium]
MINGILIVQKEQGFTSHDVVAKLRGICKQKKIGHTGTLDPNATGVLPVCLGQATKLCDLLTDHDKEYIAELLLGKTTDTQDIWGTVLTDTGDLWKSLTEKQVEDAILSFVGDQMQLPPMYSALKVNGKKLYELARAGIQVERERRPVTFYEIEILEMALPRVKIRVSCSRGTYIRTLCADIGEKLSCGAVMTALERTRVGMFEKSRSYTLSELEKLRDEGKLEEPVYPVEDCFSEFPTYYVKKEADRFLKNGNELKKTMFEIPPEEKGRIRVYDAQKRFCGVYEKADGRDTYKPWKLFLPDAEG